MSPGALSMTINRSKELPIPVSIKATGAIPINVVHAIFLYEIGRDASAADTNAKGEKGKNLRDNKYKVLFFSNFPFIVERNLLFDDEKSLLKP